LADLNDLQSNTTIKIVGTDATGVETNAVGADTNGNLKVIDYATSVTGSPVPADSSFIGAKNPTGNLVGLLTDASTNLLVSLNTSLPSGSNLIGQVSTFPSDGAKLTYSAAVTALVTTMTSPTDIFTISGSASKTIRVLLVDFTGTQTTGAARDILLLKRSTANVGGTLTNPTAVPHDSNDVAASATVHAYTVNPTTLGTLVGVIRSEKVFVATTGGGNTMVGDFFNDFGIRPSQALVLRGINESICINLNTTPSIGSTFNINIEWTEE
jgi:hypothetical protein